MDEHDKLREKVVNMMLVASNISPGAPLSQQLRRDYDTAAVMLIRSTKHPLDPKKISKHVETIQRRNAARERDACLLPPIFVKSLEKQQQQHGAAATKGAATGKAAFGGGGVVASGGAGVDDDEQHVGRAAVHHDRIVREARWAAQVRKEAEDHARLETENAAKTARDKRERFDLLRAQVEEAKECKQHESAEMRAYTAQVDEENRHIRAKRDIADALTKARRMNDRKKNDEYLATVRARKEQEKTEREQQERDLVRAVHTQEQLDNERERRQRAEKANEMRTFFQSNQSIESTRRDEMIRVRQEEIRIAPTMGIHFDGGERRTARVNARLEQQAKVFTVLAQNKGCDTSRVESRDRLLTHLEKLGDVERQREDAAIATEKQAKHKMQQQLRRELEDQIQDNARRAHQRQREPAAGGAAILLPGMIQSDENAEKRKQSEATMRAELKAQAQTQRKARRNDITGKV